ncbi:hypothetical protein B0A55_05560 [Friedmanniomyces simplex]|uniref:Signal recognition particle subunit SRP72 n=1 Tax=Friedmanniomyces simplex TaxID=329884 RepID=A0A4U0XEP8_9PEZI|nr:hypothetical protein B0A55_05560 [Friedmanniomyces simplex]
MRRVLLSQSQVSVVVSSSVVLIFTFLLFLSGYIIQQRTVTGLQAAIKPRLPKPPTPIIHQQPQDDDGQTELHSSSRLFNPKARVAYTRLSALEDTRNNDINWHRLAHVQLARNHHDVCNAIMVLAELYRLKSPARRVLLFPQEWAVEKEGKGMRGDFSDPFLASSRRLLRMAARRYGVELRPVGATINGTIEEEGGDVRGGVYSLASAYALTEFDRVLSIETPGLLFDATPLDAVLAFTEPAVFAMLQDTTEGDGVHSADLLLLQPSTEIYTDLLGHLTTETAFESQPFNDTHLPLLFPTPLLLASTTESQTLIRSIGVLHSHIQTHNPTTTSSSFNATAYLSDVAYIRFSDPKLPGPEYDVPWSQKVAARPKNKDADWTWTKLYGQFAQKRMEVCGLDLETQSHIDDHEEILKAATSALKQSKGDLDAQHAKVVALLKLDRFDDAIHAFDAGGEGLKERARLEYAYTLYKTGKPSEAAEVAQQGEERGYKHVAAQASYRTEDFRRAAELYQQLAAQPEDDAEADLRINTGAVDAQLEWAGQGDLVLKKKPGREDLEAFETAYNAACGSIARGELGQGEVLLKRARDLCNALEDLSDAEKQAELLPISVQQVYVLARQGRTAQAEELARSIDPKSIPDASTRHIAQVNSIAASEAPANPFLAQRLMAKGIHSSEPDHPFRFQTSILDQNEYAIDLQSLKFGGTADSTAEILTKQQSPTLDAYYNGLSVASAAAHAKAQTGKDALRHILPLLERRPNDVGLILTMVQLYVVTGNSGSAIALLETFLSRMEQSSDSAEMDVRFAPGLVGTMVSLYHNAGRRAQARRELSKAAQHWKRRKGQERSTGVVHLLKAAGTALLESQEAEHQELATEIFTDLNKEDESDRYAAAGLLAASPETASQASTASLQPIDRLTSAIDTDALEAAGIAQPPSATAPAVSTRKRPAEPNANPSKPKRPRKSRLPKDYDPSKPPDPERWLPLRDRSTYRPKGGKKGKAQRQNLLSQGSAPTLGGAGVESEGSRPGTPAGGEVVKGKVVPGKGAKRKGKR